jgi:hypothetical protein
MSRPGLLLVILLVLAGIAGRFLVSVHDKNTAPPKEPKLSSEASAPPPTAPVAQGGEGGTVESELLNEAYQLSQARQLQYQDALELLPNSAAAIQKAWQRQLVERFPSETLDRLGLTLQLLGILPSDEDLTARYRLRANLSPEVTYDSQEGSLLHTKNLTLTDPESKEWLAFQLTLMLLDQNFQWHESLIPTEVNMDRSLAQLAYVQGDATWQALKHTKTDVAKSHAWKRTDTLTNNWPRALREAEFLPLREGVHFCQAIAGQNVMLDAVYQQLPSSTAQIIHPDRYLEIPRWEPRNLRWAQRDILRSEPVWDNVIGELMIRGWLQSALPAEDAALLAAGWEGDGVLLYQTEDEAPQLVWKTAWRNASTAERFFKLLTDQAKALFEIEGAPEKSDTTATFPDVLGPKLILAEDTVTLLRTTTPTWAEALEDVAQRSRFRENKP